MRLALFAEMMKGKAVDAGLAERSGRHGGGRRHLPRRNVQCGHGSPEHRYHQKAARGVLKALLPESGTDIKGHMRSHAELLEARAMPTVPRILMT